MSGTITLGNEVFREGIAILPVASKAISMSLSANAELVGIRFHPAIGYGVLGTRFHQVKHLTPEQTTIPSLNLIYEQLRLRASDTDRITAVEQWAKQDIDFSNALPSVLKAAFESIHNNTPISQLNRTTNKSQRQLERLFKERLGVSPKKYQRILRVRRALHLLRQNRSQPLADIAQEIGFSDQAHMTREFRTIIGATPRKS